jgi:hypothetical protein
MLPMGSVGITSKCYTGPGRATSTERLSWSRPGASRQEKKSKLMSIFPLRKRLYGERADTLPDQESACKLLLNRSGSPSGRSDSIFKWASSQIGAALASRVLPFRVKLSLRLRRSAGSGLILTRPRRCSGLSAAVKVVRSMASSDATGPIPGGSGRFNDISKEN